MIGVLKRQTAAGPALQWRAGGVYALTDTEPSGAIVSS
jgi:hypothetical protein